MILTTFGQLLPNHVFVVMLDGRKRTLCKKTDCIAIDTRERPYVIECTARIIAASTIIRDIPKEGTNDKEFGNLSNIPLHI